LTQATGEPLSADTRVSRMELAISTLLRAGILISLAIVLTGVVVMYVHHPDYLSSAEPLEHLKSTDYKFPNTLTGIFKDALDGQGRAIVLLGVFVLFMTPVLRVAVSIVGFLMEKDWKFVAITSVVLATLLLSLVLGRSA
jgi:uncharacterized membrane protein